LQPLSEERQTGHSGQGGSGEEDEGESSGAKVVVVGRDEVPGVPDEVPGMGPDEFPGVGRSFD